MRDRRSLPVPEARVVNLLRRVTVPELGLREDAASRQGDQLLPLRRRPPVGRAQAGVNSRRQADIGTREGDQVPHYREGPVLDEVEQGAVTLPRNLRETDRSGVGVFV